MYFFFAFFELMGNWYISFRWSSSPQVAVSFGTRAHPQRMLSGDQRPAALLQPPPAGWVRGVPQTEIELLQFHKCASDQHPSAPTRLTFASSVASRLARIFYSVLEQLQRIPVEICYPPWHVPPPFLSAPSFSEGGMKPCKWSLWNWESN